MVLRDVREGEVQEGRFVLLTVPGRRTAGTAPAGGGGEGRRGRLGHGEVVPAVEDGLLAELGETFPVGGSPLVLLLLQYGPLAYTGTATKTVRSGQTQIKLTPPGPVLLTNRLAPDILPFIFIKVLEIHTVFSTVGIFFI